MTKCYIAGPITHDKQYRKHFKAAETYIKSFGYEVYNPAAKGKGLKLDYKGYIDLGLKALMEADIIYLLKGWQDSDGTKLEQLYARTVGTDCVYEEFSNKDSLLKYLMEEKQKNGRKGKELKNV